MLLCDTHVMKVPPDFLRFLVHCIVMYGKRARWLDFLSTFVMVNGRPLKGNQAALLSLS